VYTKSAPALREATSVSYPSQDGTELRSVGTSTEGHSLENSDFILLGTANSEPHSGSTLLAARNQRL
jgi:hypothetical protein